VEVTRQTREILISYGDDGCLVYHGRVHEFRQECNCVIRSNIVTCLVGSRVKSVPQLSRWAGAMLAH